MHRFPCIALLATLVAIAVPATASAGGAGDPGGSPYYDVGPTIIVAPKGFYRSYVKQLHQASAVCGFGVDNASNSGTGVWTPDQQAKYYKLVDAFNRSRARLNVKLARKGLGFAPALQDWMSISRFKERDGGTTLLLCPVG